MTTLLDVAMPSLSPLHLSYAQHPTQLLWYKVSPKRIKSLERDEQTKRFEELINKKRYKEIAELGKEMSDEELLKCLCQVVTSLDHFKGLYEYLKQRKMVPAFLAHGEMAWLGK